MTLPSASVEVRVGDGPARAFLRTVVVVGRDPTCDVVIDDPAVSRRHCEIRIGEYGTSIADCSSSNGTYCDTGRIGAMVLAPGRVYTVRLGDPTGVAIGVSTNVPLRGPAGKTSQTWSIDQFAFQPVAARPGPEPAEAREEPGPTEVPAARGQPPVAQAGGALPTVSVEVFVIGMPAEHRSLTLRRATIRIGRSRGSDVVLPDVAEDTSGVHAELRWDGKQLWVVDLGSTNGTYVEGERVAWRPLTSRGRSTIRLGHSGTGIVVAYAPTNVVASQRQPRPTPPPPPPRSSARQRRETEVGPHPVVVERSLISASPEPTRGVVIGELADLGAAGTLARAIECGARWYRSSPSTHAIELGVIGVAGAGKSSLLNALLAPGCQLLPAGGVGSLTAVPIRVSVATEPVLRVAFRPRTWLVEMLRTLGRPKKVPADVLGALSLLCTGDQHGVRDPEWLVLALRHALNPDVGRLPDETHETRSALSRLSSFLTANRSQREWTASENAPDFFYALREHIAGQMSPLCASVSVGWPSPLLAAGTTIVDLPGMGSAHDAHASTTAGWLETGNAVLVVCDRAGLTDAVVRALRDSGFAKRWADGAARLMVSVTKLDLVADDEVRAQPGLKWSDAFSAVSARATSFLRSQLATAVPEAADHAASVPICSVSARELQRLASDDADDPSLLRDPVEAGFPALHDAVLALSGHEQGPVSEVASTSTRLGPEPTVAPGPTGRAEPLTGDEPSMSELDGTDEATDRWEAWLQRSGRPFFERWDPTRVAVLEQLIAEVRATASPGRRELPICLLGNAGVGKSTLINALIDPLMLIVPQGGVGPLTAQATVVRYASDPFMRATYHGARRLNQLVFALDRYCERQLRAAHPDDNEIDPSARQEAMLAFVQADDAGAGEREAVEQRLRSYISQARQLVRGNQFGDDAIDEVAYLADGLREAMGRPPIWGRALHEDDRDRIQALREAVAVGEEGRSHRAGADRAAFLREVRRHATGSISPLIKSLEVGWDSALLKDGLVLVDLPGVGVANDEYRSVTSDWIRRATAVLLVVDRAGVTEPAAELLRTTGFLNALLHRAPEAKTVAPLLWVISVKLDDVAQDERTSFRQQNPDAKVPPWQSFFDDASAKVRVLVRNQLDTEFAKLADGDDMREARAQVHRGVLDQLQVHPVSAIEYRKLMADDEDDRPRIKDPEQSNLPALSASLQAIAQRHATEIAERVAESLSALAASAQRGLRAVLDDLEQGDRDQVRLAKLRSQLAEVLAPRSKELALRQGQLRERLRGTVPKTIEREVARAVQTASSAVTAYLKGLERVNWATLRAAVRRGGVRVGNRAIDIPNELALRIEGPLAVIWNKTVVSAVSGALDEFARDLERILDEVLSWAQSEEAALDATRVVRYRDDVVLRLKQLAGITDATTDSLRADVKQRLHETVQEAIRSECRAFVDSGRDVGAGVKNRVHAFLADAGSVARVQAGATAEKYLVETYERVVSGIGAEFASVANALADVEGIVVGHFHAATAEDMARARDEARVVRAMLDELPPAAKAGVGV